MEYPTARIQRRYPNRTLKAVLGGRRYAMEATTRGQFGQLSVTVGIFCAKMPESAMFEEEEAR